MSAENDHGLSDDELAMAQSFNISPAQYSAHKNPGYRPPTPAQTEHEKLKQAIREALDERAAGGRS